MANNKIKKVLIANRGEIAVRIQRACQGLGLKSVIVASEVDKEAFFARNASELAIIGPAAASESYLNIEKIISTAKELGCDAVHPGYGFLSENSKFAARLEEEGIIFIGPSAHSIETMGDKIRAKKQAASLKIPLLGGTSGKNSDSELIKEAQRLGLPLIIKASAGGGGRGMRVVREICELEASIKRARSEAKKSFGSDAVYLEKYLENPRHVEVQIFGDGKGAAVHFGTRDCSVQRRHQKIVEEAPAPDLSPALRSEIEKSAVKIASSINYKGAGTVEFLVEKESYYFLEMNTRIQVEHPVTEEVTGYDLVALQIHIASGEPLPQQKDIKISGHAIEYRIYAEDPYNNFFPTSGRLNSISRPAQDWAREDYGFEAGDTINTHYDALISKVIIKGRTRSEALTRSLNYFYQYKLEGIETNLQFHRWLILCSPFRIGAPDVAYIDRAFDKECLSQAQTLTLRDRSHQEPKDKLKKVEFLKYFSAKHQMEYTIEVTHEEGALFLARPARFKPEPAPAWSARLSNAKKDAIESLIKEVLEVFSPEEIL
jgi:acetyl/propionyl-CoA carboxylase alpha subunit